MNTMANDKFLDYYAVMEQTTTPDDGKFEILGMVDKMGSSFLRFRACLQSFITRNRNGRLWKGVDMKQMILAATVQELLHAGGVPGENGHPVPATGEVTVERILTIDPNNLSHFTKEYQWEGDRKIYGIIETADEGPGTPGYKFMRNILQGIDPAFSTRSLVPQRKNLNGTIDVTGPGRFVTHDRVFLPSHDDAYIDKSVPIKNIITKSKFETVMESYVSFVVERSDKVNIIADGLQPAMEAATMDKNGLVSIPVSGGQIFVYPENKYRNELKSFMKTL